MGGGGREGEKGRDDRVEQLVARGARKGGGRKEQEAESLFFFFDLLSCFYSLFLFFFFTFFWESIAEQHNRLPRFVPALHLRWSKPGVDHLVASQVVAEQQQMMLHSFQLFIEIICRS